MSKITYLPAALDKREAELNLFYNKLILYEHEISIREGEFQRKRRKIRLYSMAIFLTGFLTGFLMLSTISG